MGICISNKLDSHGWIFFRKQVRCSALNLQLFLYQLLVLFFLNIFLLLLLIFHLSQLGKACNYALGQWEAIKHYLNNGHVEIDNNSCERSIRPVAIGRKNWIHIGSENAGPKIAGIISIVETCLKLEIRPRDYLKEILPEVADRLKTGRQELSDLTPMAWKANQSTTAWLPLICFHQKYAPLHKWALWGLLNAYRQGTSTPPESKSMVTLRWGK